MMSVKSKNIHVLPTDKPSRLFIADGKLFNYHKPQQGDGLKIINQNIYITSDERIERGDWLFDAENEEHIYRASDVDLSNIRSLKSWYCKKIILTTDQDLINYGVQAIDDEFLEWFVNNPSCEFVDTERYCSAYLKSQNINYKIIIPKEEPKKETLEEVAERYYEDEVSINAFINGVKWQQKQICNHTYLLTSDLDLYRVIKCKKCNNIQPI